jgi:hypothetical protein
MSIGELKPELTLDQIVSAVVNRLRSNSYSFPNVLPIQKYGQDINLATVQNIRWVNDLNNPTAQGPVTAGTLRYYKLFMLDGPDSDIRWYIIVARGVSVGGSLPQTFYIENIPLPDGGVIPTFAARNFINGMELFYHKVECMLVTSSQHFVAKITTSLNPPPSFQNQSFWFIFSGV